jgi:ATP-dependent Clp protease ATP-binding subunit ClpA
VPAFSQSLETALHRALEYANERHHEYATLEHLLLSLLDDRDAAAVMKACSVDLDELKARVTEYLDNELSSLFVKGSTEAQPTTGFQRVIHRAVVHVQSSGREEVTGANVLVAIFAERESHAVFFLQEQDMSRLDAVNYISHGVAKVPGRSETRRVRGAAEEENGSSGGNSQGQHAEKPGKRGQEALAAYATHLRSPA